MLQTLKRVLVFTFIDFYWRGDAEGANNSHIKKKS